MDEQTRWNYMEAELESAENKVRELEAALKQQTAYCKKCCRDNEYSPRLIATEKKVVELEKELEEIRDCLYSIANLLLEDYLINCKNDGETS